MTHHMLPVVLLAVICLDATAGLSVGGLDLSVVERGVRSHVRRQKRGLFGPDCKEVCLEELDAKLDDDGDSSSGSNEMDFSLPTAFSSPEAVDQICREFNDTYDCRSKCDASEMEPTEEILKFVCEENLEGFREAVTCYVAANETVVTCPLKCDIGSVMASMGQLDSLDEGGGGGGGGNPFGGLLGIMDTMCGFMQCVLECEVPIYDEMCSSTVPGELKRAFFARMMSSSMAPLRMLGLDSIFGPKCKQLMDGKAATSDDKPKSASGQDEELIRLEKQKLTKELEVLEKTYYKLDVEMEKLKMEKEVLQMQLDKEL